MDLRQRFSQQVGKEGGKVLFRYTTARGTNTEIVINIYFVERSLNLTRPVAVRLSHLFCPPRAYYYLGDKAEQAPIGLHAAADDDTLLRPSNNDFPTVPTKIAHSVHFCRVENIAVI